jgi:hypothetical protein
MSLGTERGLQVQLCSEFTTHSTYSLVLNLVPGIVGGTNISGPKFTTHSTCSLVLNLVPGIVSGTYGLPSGYIPLQHLIQDTERGTSDLFNTGGLTVKTVADVTFQSGCLALLIHNKQHGYSTN